MIRMKLFFLVVARGILNAIEQAAALLRRLFPSSYKVAHLHIKIAGWTMLREAELYVRARILRAELTVKPARPLDERVMSTILWIGCLYVFFAVAADAQVAYAEFMQQHWDAAK